MGNKHVIYQSLIKNQTFLLADRQLCMSLAFLCIVLACLSLTFIGVLLSILLFAMGYTALYKMQMHDALLWKVYLRNIRYKAFYEAKETINSKGYTN